MKSLGDPQTLEPAKELTSLSRNKCLKIHGQQTLTQPPLKAAPDPFQTFKAGIVVRRQRCPSQGALDRCSNDVCTSIVLASCTTARAT
jgi:hypothetical protein